MQRKYSVATLKVPTALFLSLLWAYFCTPFENQEAGRKHEGLPHF